MSTTAPQPIVAPNTALVLGQGVRSSLNIALPAEAGAALSVTITSLPTGGAIFFPNGQAVGLGAVLTPYQLTTLIYQAPAGASGAMGAFSYTVTDGKGGSASETVALSVTPPPTVEANKAISALQGAKAALAITQPTDAAGYPLSITVTRLPWQGSVQLASGQAVTVGQTLTSAQLAGLVYSAPAAGIGDSGIFSYAVSDGHGGTASETVSLNVNAPLVVEAGKSIAVAAGGSRTALNITPPSETGNYNGLVATITSVPTQGSIVLAAGNQPVTVGQTLTPYQLATLLYVGPASGSGAMGAFSYAVTDGKGGSASETVSLAVTPPPTVEANKSITVIQGQSGALAIAQPTDAAGLPTTITVTSVPWQGAVTLSTGQAVKAGQVLTPAQLSGLVYNAPAGTAGSSGAFSYSVSDGRGGVASETVTLGVKAVLVVEGSKAVNVANAGGAIALNITPPSETANYNGLTATITGVPAKGSITMAGSTQPVTVGQTLTPYQLATLIYKGPAGATGAMGAFSYSVTDGQGGNASETVTLTVGTNHAPVAAANKTLATNFNGSTPLAIAAPTDADGDALSITVSAVPTGSLVTAAGKVVAAGSMLSVAELTGLVYTAPAGQSGAMGGFSYTVSDGHGGTAAETVSLTVNPSPSPAWVGALSDPVIKAAMQAASATGTVSEAGMATLFTNLGKELAASGQTLSASQFADLKSIAANIGVGESASSYVSFITNALVNGNAANATWTGGAATSTALGNLAVGSTATQLGELTGKWFLGTDLPSTVAGNVMSMQSTYTAVNGPLYGASGAPNITDVNQGAAGDCFLEAQIAEIASQNPSSIQSMITDNGNGTYGVQLNLFGQSAYVTVNNVFATLNGSTIYNSSSGAIWADVLEKAFATVSGNSYSFPISYGTPAVAYEIAGATSEVGYGFYNNVLSQYNITLNPATELQNEFFAGVQTLGSIQQAVITELANGYDVYLSSSATDYDSSGKQTLVPNHILSVVGFDATNGDFIIRNPWGNGTSWEGTFEANLSTLLVTDHVGITSDLIGSAAGQTLKLTAPTADQTWSVGVPLSFTLPSDTFCDPKGLAVTYKAIQADGSALPAWLSFNTATGAFTGTPPTPGAVGIVVTATDSSGASVSETFNLAVANQPVTPTVTGTTLPAMIEGQSVDVATMFILSLPAGTAATEYRLQVTGGTGTINLNGATNLASAAQAASGVVIIAASEIDKLTYTAGTTADPETLSIAAQNAYGWGNTASAAVALVAPKVIGNHLGVATNGSLALSTLFNASDPTGAAIVAYSIQAGAGGGSINLGTATNLATAAQTANGIIVVAKSDIGKLKYVAGGAIGNQSISIAAEDSYGWGLAATATVATETPATLAAKTVTVAQGRPVSALSLFSVANPGGGPITHYDILDPVGGGSIQLNGAVNWGTPGYYDILAADIGKVTYVGGGAVGSEKLTLYALNDTYQWSNAATVTVNTVPANVVTANAASVNLLNAGQPVDVVNATVAGTTITANLASGTSLSSFATINGSSGIDTLVLTDASADASQLTLSSVEVLESAANLTVAQSQLAAGGGSLTKLVADSGSGTLTIAGNVDLTGTTLSGFQTVAVGSNATVNAGANNVTLAGGSGNDYVFTAASFTDTVVDSGAGGKIDLSGTGQSLASASRSGNDLVLGLANGSSVTVQGEFQNGGFGKGAITSVTTAGRSWTVVAGDSAGSASIVVGDASSTSITDLSFCGGNMLFDQFGNRAVTGSQAGGDMMSVAGGDVVTAFGGNNVLHGAGQDSLILSTKGADTVCFNSASEGGDIIANFVSGTDKIQVYSPNFGNVTVGALGSADFFSGANVTASNSLAAFLYDTASHTLYYDGNGHPGTAVEIAHLTNNAQLASTDIVAVSHKQVG